MEKKIEYLAKLYLSAFEIFKKGISKKDRKYEEIKNAYNALKDAPKNFTSYTEIRNYSLLLVQPYEQPCPIKIIDKILITVEEIIRKTLVDQSIMQEMVSKLLFHFTKIANYPDDTIKFKIINMCLLIYQCELLSIHSSSLKNIFKTCLIIYISAGMQTKFRVKEILSQIVDMIIKKMDLYIERSHCDKSILSSTSDHDYHNILSKVYTEYILDIIEICQYAKSEKQKELLETYISLFKSQIDSNDLIKEIEMLDLENSNIINNTNESGKKIGKYGYCVFCRNSASKFNKKVKLPLCDNIECEGELLKLFTAEKKKKIYYSISYREDFISIVKYLSGYSKSESKETNSDDICFSRCHEFCLCIMNEMLKKAPPYLSHDIDLIAIIKDQIMDSLVTNTLSNDINILKLSLNLFLIIIKRYRQHLKEQIALFINRVLLVILESENLGFDHKIVVLEVLFNLSLKCEYLVEFYVNYDCSMSYNAIFYDLLNLITKIINGFYKKSKFASLLKPAQEKTLRLKCFEFLTQFIHKLSDLVEKNLSETISVANEIKESDTTNEEEFRESLTNSHANTGETNFNLAGSGLSEKSTIVGEVKDQISQTLKLKNLLNKAIEKFNISDQKGSLKFLMTNNIIQKEKDFNQIKDSFIQAVTDNGMGIANFLKTTDLFSDSDKDLPFRKGLTQNYDDYINTNIFTLPFFCSGINPLIYYLQNLDREKLTTCEYEDYTAFEMARFIKTNVSDFKRNPLGDYLCSGKK